MFSNDELHCNPLILCLPLVAHFIIDSHFNMVLSHLPNCDHLPSSFFSVSVSSVRVKATSSY